MARDSLRTTLDELRLDESSAKDRPYLEAMLRRLGYTEKEIRAELGPPVEAVPAPVVEADDALAPAREYRLVVPARESAFSFAPPDGRTGPDSPFEAFERVEFEESAPEEETVEFVEEAPLDFTPEEPAAVPDPMPLEEFQEAPVQEFEAAPLEELQAAPVEDLQEDATGQVEDVGIETFGADVDTKPRTRVRVKRVRAKSKAEAEAKVSGANRRVIKSIPVDIVERWGGAPAPQRKPKTEDDA